LGTALADAAASTDKLIAALDDGKMGARERAKIEKALMRGRKLMRELADENEKIGALLYCATSSDEMGH
jgi:hypothetical protein